MIPTTRLPVLLMMFGLIGTLAGCAAEDPQFAALREQFLLNQEPAGATTIAEARAQLASDPAIVLVGRVGAGEHEAFTRGKATFVVSEILPDEHGHGSAHDSSGCPFCKRKADEAPLVAVQFVDATGQIAAADAQQLFGIKSGDTVVVRGHGELVEGLDLFQVTADGLYIRRSEL